VSVPPGEYDIYSFHQLRESLARLVTENLQVKRWLFKIDNEFAGRGTAFCDVTPYLSCHAKALKEAERYGDKWVNRWAHEPTFQAIFREIGHIIEMYATLSDNCIYSDWKEFLEKFLQYGGLIEASPPTDSVTSLTANLFIEPGGTPHLLSVVDQIHSSSSYSCWGYSIPQSSIEPAVINEVTLSIAEGCRERGMVGYMSVNYITFIDPRSLSTTSLSSTPEAFPKYYGQWMWTFSTAGLKPCSNSLPSCLMQTSVCPKIHSSLLSPRILLSIQPTSQRGEKHSRPKPRSWRRWTDTVCSVRICSIRTSTTSTTTSSSKCARRMELVMITS